MSVALPKGPLRYPLTINEEHPAVTKADSTANVESEIVTIRVPRKNAWAIREGDQLYLYLATSVPAQITAGSIKVLIADASKVLKLAIVDWTPVSAFPTLDDETKKFRFKAGFSRDEDQYIIIVYKGASVAAAAQTKLLLTGVCWTEL